jgi:hypothetical protein
MYVYSEKFLCNESVAEYFFFTPWKPLLNGDYGKCIKTVFL